MRPTAERADRARGRPSIASSRSSASCARAARTIRPIPTRSIGRPSSESSVPGVLVDASALIALLDRDDHHHERCVDALKSIRDPLATVWPALTEAMHLLSGTARAPGALCDMVADGALRLV